MDISWNHTLLTATAIISEEKHVRRREGNCGILPSIRVLKAANGVRTCRSRITRQVLCTLECVYNQSCFSTLCNKFGGWFCLSVHSRLYSPSGTYLPKNLQSALLSGCNVHQDTFKHITALSFERMLLFNNSVGCPHEISLLRELTLRGQS